MHQVRGTPKKILCRAPVLAGRFRPFCAAPRSIPALQAITIALIAATVAAVADADSSHVLTKENFEFEVFQSGKSAFVKFMAPWCAAQLDATAVVAALQRKSCTGVVTANR